MNYDIIIIGAGPAGLSASIYAQRAGLKTVCLEGNIHGGQIINTPEVENYPALGKISGVEYATQLYDQAVGFGTVVEYDMVSAVDFSATAKKVTTASGAQYEAKAVIIANGVIRRKLDVPGEDEYTGRGVSYCATCDGALFAGKTVFIVGGGNTALEDAVYLAAVCEKVYLVHRRDEFRGVKHEVEKVLRNPKIEVLYDSVVKNIKGGAAVTAVEVENVKTGERKTYDTAAIFVAVGLIPQNELLKNIITLTPEGYIASDESCKTNIEGVFAAGDTRAKTLRQLITAASDGAVAATAASAYIAGLE